MSACKSFIEISILRCYESNMWSDGEISPGTRRAKLAAHDTRRLLELLV